MRKVQKALVVWTAPLDSARVAGLADSDWGQRLKWTLGTGSDSERGVGMVWSRLMATDEITTSKGLWNPASHGLVIESPLPRPPPIQ